jgi:hypothetical protein
LWRFLRSGGEWLKSPLWSEAQSSTVKFVRPP